MIGKLLSWISDCFGNCEALEVTSRLFIWICFHVLIGLLPVLVMWWLLKLDPEADLVERDFYWEGAFLFLGTAITGALCAELTVTQIFLPRQGLSAIALIFMGIVSFLSAITYGYMLTKREKVETMLPVIKEVSDAVLISSAVFAFSVTAVLYGQR